ncbi:MAG TPA: NADH-quinone oxidoreductase subunit L [Longimicrobiales bacterium]|nr:NADH-quinone oxidoreductase subunit L [Longimicrobiales bacterium]
MHEFHPTLLWAIALLPLLGFVINGAVSMVDAQRNRPAPAPGHDAHGHDAHGHDHGHGLDEEADVHGHDDPHAAVSGNKLIPTIVGPGVMLLAFGIALVNFIGMLGADLHGPIVETYFQWMPVGSLQVDAAFHLDQLSMLMTMIITGVGLLIHIFSVGYMKEDPGYARYFAYLNLFVFFMLVLVLGSSYALMFVGWEGVGLCSYLLIGFWFKDREKADAGKKAFIVNRIGDAGFLIAMFLLFSNLGSLDFARVMEAAPGTFVYGGAVITAITLFFFLGAAGKSAQIPLYVWLPDAMAGPTPVSALIHAATMVTAGVYLVARSSVLFAMAPVSSITVAGVGALTALFAASIGLVQTDIKKVLAYSTVSQLGYMFVGVGVGAYAAGVFHLMTHAFFKALLFLGSGAVIHAMHHAYHETHNHADAQDMRNMGGLRKYMPITWIVMWIGTLAIAGVWPFAGFFSKDEIIWQAAARAVGPFEVWFRIFWVMALAAAMMTAFYMTRLMVMTFHGENRTGDAERKHLHEVSPVMWVPLAILAVASVVGGWINVPHAIADTWMGIVPHSEWLHAWLHPITEAADHVFEENVGALAHSSPVGGGEAYWAMISFALAVAIVVIASMVLSRRRYQTAAKSPAARGFGRVLYNKWYVDEVYDAGIVRPLGALSRGLWRWVDQGLIDGAVNGLGYTSRAFGWVGSRLQTGQLNTYAFAAVLGAVLLLIIVAT